MKQIQFTDGVNLSGLEKARLFQKLISQGTRTEDDVLSEIESVDADPTALSKFSSLLGAAHKFISEGAEIISADEQAERLAICHGCPKYNSSAFIGSGSCSLCGCSIKLKIKARAFSCPLKHW